MKCVLGIILLFGLSVKTPAISFNFEFRDTSQSLIGTGFLELQSDPGNQQIALVSQNFSLVFHFPSFGTFLTTDIVTLNGVDILLFENNGQRPLKFGGDAGPNFGGSPELQNLSGFFLSFDPGSMEFFRIDSPSKQPLVLGTYVATSSHAVPEAGSTFPLLMSIAVLLISASRMRSSA